MRLIARHAGVKLVENLFRANFTSLTFLATLIPSAMLTLVPQLRIRKLLRMQRTAMLESLGPNAA